MISKTAVIAALIIAVATLIAGATYAYAHDSNPAPATAPSGVSVSDTNTPGDVTVSWQAVAGAAYYRIGWVALEDFHAVTGAGREWLDAFAFTDIANQGQATHTIRGLRAGQEYAFIVATINSRFGNGAWSGWTYHTPAADIGPTPVIPPPPATATPTPAGTPTPTPTPAPVNGDYDADNDGLIEIRTLAQLDAVRHDLDGNGVAQSSRYRAAFPNPMNGMGCPDTCGGYELAQDIDLDSNGNGRFDAGDTLWHNGAGWTPIGNLDGEGDLFNTTLDGNGYAIRNLMVDWNDADYVGLIRVIGRGGVIRNISVPDAEVIGQNRVGVIAGENRGDIADVSVSGSVNGSGAAGGITAHTAADSEIVRATADVAVAAASGNAGGLAASAAGATIRLAKATGNVTASTGQAGGLIAGATDTTIEDSCASGNVRGTAAGGLIASATDATISRSCATGDVTGTSHIAGGLINYAYRTEITDSYAYGTIRTSGGGSSAYPKLGGIVAYGESATVRNSYFSGTMRGQSVCRNCHHRCIGGCGARSYNDPSYYGIISDAAGTAKDTYWDKTVQEETASSAGIGKSTRELQAPTENVGIYRKWDPAVWDFGDSVQYPALKGNAMPPAEQRAGH